jgi:hypothetical protein
MAQDEDEEALRLIRAFYEIRDRKARRIIIAVVEAAARGALVKIEEPDGLGIEIGEWSISGENTSH